MPADQGKALGKSIALRWCGLAERRLAHIAELHSSGRWAHYYTEERFVQCMLDAIKAVTVWRKLSGQTPSPAADKSNLRPAA